MQQFRQAIDKIYQNRPKQQALPFDRSLCRMDKYPPFFYQTGMIWDEEIDATGLLCPLPVLKARKRLKAMTSGTVLRLIATDPAAVIDVPHFCSESGHTLIQADSDSTAQIYYIRRL
jgi:tRNA 2-thiouridine synthesizing protein A